MLASLLGLALALRAAAPSEPGVSWDAPASCSDATAVRRRIEDLLRRPLAPGELDVAAVVRPEGEAFVLHLRVRNGDVLDERELRASRCAALADTAALVAAVIIDPAVADALLVPEPEEPEPEPVEPEPEPVEPAEPEPAEPDPAEPDPAEAASAKPSLLSRADRSTAAPPREPMRPWIRARAGGELGAIPRGTGGAALGVALGRPRLRAELEGQYWVGRVAESPHARARIHLGLVAARTCAVVPRRPLAAALCGGLELGAVRADAIDPRALTRHRPWLAAQAEVALRWQPRPGVALWVGAQPFVPIVFPRFELIDPAAPASPETIHAPSAVGVRGLLGIELRAAPR